MAKKFEIRNSTAEFLTFVAEGKEQGVQVLYGCGSINVLSKEKNGGLLHIANLGTNVLPQNSHFLVGLILFDFAMFYIF